MKLLIELLGDNLFNHPNIICPSHTAFLEQFLAFNTDFIIIWWSCVQPSGARFLK